jgi:hypothetical protein
VTGCQSASGMRWMTSFRTSGVSRATMI